ncbi:protein POOR HOMOLOGOUS SYNAPSIS 1 [Quillaja saponaria]|uniref:Protein POOR HOMOLOGOUS SYNAPSIS 1 n=1 Tax=Quillaja saponaria TaxID=32244 RepID=A0AAD7LDM7_QUISA|nr:protein POOR HOMOLOGOUS SYNAPSIS 1 [Quillaja saponaria]
MGGDHLPQSPSETLDTFVKEQWEIHYSRFFNFPSLPSTSPLLKPLSRKRKELSSGTWVTLSSMATLHLVTDHEAQELALIISSPGNFHWEEHYISNLHFSWPQVSCLAECPSRGSRVVFGSKRDFVGQNQTAL